MPRPTRRQALTALAAGAAAGSAAGWVAGCSPRAGAPDPAPTPTPGSRRFPDGFAWGAATSAYQVEGAVDEDGRGPSVWDAFSASPGRTADGGTGEVACDHYHRYPEDLDMLARLGVRSYRFSISWPRVQPTGSGPVNTAGMDFYQRLVGGLLARGITPVATLWHWDTPQALQEVGGWAARDTASRFAEYATAVAQALAGTVPTYLTLEEPKTAVVLGHLTGVHAPGLREPATAAAALHHLLLGHGLAVQAIRAADAGTRVGIVLNLSSVRAADDSPGARAAAALRDGVENRLYLDPVFTGGYPGDVLAGGGTGGLDAPALRASVRAGDMDTIASPLDVLGVNHAPPLVVDAAGRTVDRRPPPAEELRSLSEGLHETLTRVALDYGNPVLSVTGSGHATPAASGHPTADPGRTEHLREHLHQAHRAVGEGVRLEGFHVESLLDGFEWSEGYGQRRGLVHVDFDTGTRTAKDSAWWYSEVIAANAL
ncbi:GH1 family beta-glucosidase [Kineococcus sp. NUM-3379]